MVTKGSQSGSRKPSCNPKQEAPRRLFKQHGERPCAPLLTAGASATVKSQKSIGYSLVTRKRLTPLLTLGKVECRITDWGRKHPDFNSATTVKSSKIGIGRLRGIVGSNANCHLRFPVPGHKEIALKN